MKQTQQSIEKYESCLKRRIQNRKSSQKVRKGKDCKIFNFEKKIEDLEKENETLIKKTESLTQQNNQLSKQVKFYQQAFDKTIKQQKEDVEVVLHPNEDGYYRVERGSKGKDFMKALLMLTIFTIMVQTVNIGGTDSILNASEGPSRLNFLDTGKINTLESHTGFFK